MLFALICAALLLIVIAAVTLPLLSGGRTLPMRGDYDRAVYRDQLREVERDLARGVLTEAEASAARLEIQRRLLAADTTTGTWTTSAGSRGPLLACAAALFVVLGSGALYWRLGAPGLADAPFADRPPEQAEPTPDDQRTNIKQAAEQLEQKLLADPSNATGWLLYARAESILGEWNKAADAYQHAIDLGSKQSDVYAGYGEMQVMAADGIVAPAAREAFTTALTADPSSAVARYYLALAAAQSGEAQKAIDAWTQLAAGLPEGSPMRDAIAGRIADAAKSAGIAAPPLPKGLAADAPPPGPTTEQMDAAASMTPEQRAQMIDGMIEKLAAKLKDQPNDLDGWMRLGRAYLVRGDSAKSVDAYDHAAALKPGDPEIELQTVAALLSGLKPEDPLPPRALAMLSEVAAVAPDAPEVLWYLGLVAARDGRPAEAREKWTKLLESLPDGEDAKMVKAAIGELKGK